MILTRIRTPIPIWDMPTQPIEKLPKTPLWRLPTLRHAIVKIRDKLPKMDFTCSDVTEMIPAINEDETEMVEAMEVSYDTELMPVYTEHGILTRTWSAIKALK